MKKENYVHKTQNTAQETVSTVKMVANTATPPPPPPPSENNLAKYKTPFSGSLARLRHKNSRPVAGGAVVVLTAIALTILLIACPEETPPAGNGNTAKTPAGGACVTDTDCADSLVCTGALGTQICSQAGDGTVGSLCGTDNHCTDPLVCDAGLCSGGAGSVGEMCTDNDGCTDPLVCGDNSICGIPSGNSCSTDTQCADPLICTGTAGAQVCSTAGDGLTGSVCGNNDHCDGALICGNGLCRVAAGGTCTADSDCANTLICTGVSGSQVCSQAGTGAGGSVCGNDDHCTDALICGSGACGVAAGDACSVSDDCVGTLMCSANVCSTGAAGSACNADDQCTNPLVCNGAAGSQMCGDAGNGMSGSACGNNDHCTAPLICGAGTCDADTDGDSIADNADNCPNVPNTDQAITTGDTAGHACNTDIDDDDDGLIEIWTLEQLHNMRYNLAGTTYDDELADTGTNADAGITTGAPTAATADCTTATGGVYLCGYELMNNLDFDLDGDGSTVKTDGTLDTDDDASPHFVVANGGWEPIGSQATTFDAIFEGNGFTISNLAIRRNLIDIGLFGAINGAHIRNVGIVGGLIAYTGSSSTANLVGAIAGSVLRDSIVSASYAAVNIDAGDGGESHAGGLIGWMSEGNVSIIASYATGDVDGGDNGRDRIGGLVGTHAAGFIIASYATGDVSSGSADGDVGGLVGRQSGGSIDASYATGDITGGGGDDNVGGLSGSSVEPITASYATGDVDAGTGTGDRAGSLVGLNAGTTITASYGFGEVTNGETAGLSPMPAGVSVATALTAANAGQCSNRTYTTETACTSTSLAITAGSWDSTDMECSAPDSGATAGVDYTTYTTMATCTAPGTKTTAHTWTTWSNAANDTLNAWVFGTGVTPKLRYADYDGAGSMYACSLFPSTVTCGAAGDQLPGQPTQ